MTGRKLSDVERWQAAGMVIGGMSYRQTAERFNESGPTFVGDEWSDPKLMEYIGATKIKALGNNFAEWKSEDCPRIVLNKLEKKGYKVVAVTGVGQTCIWTLNKPDESIS